MEELLGAFAVARLVAGEQRPRVVVLGVGEPGAGAHALVHLECVLEVLRGLVPVSHRRGEQSEVTRHGADGEIAGGDRIQPRVGKELAVKNRRTVAVLEVRSDLGENGETEEPLGIARKRSEIIGCQLVEHASRLLPMPELPLEKCKEAAERAISGVLVDGLSDHVLDLRQPALLAA